MRQRLLIPPLLTPLHTDESVDRLGLTRLIEHVLQGGATGIFVLGSSGEGAFLTHTQRRTVVDVASTVIARRVPLFVGISDCSISRVRELMSAVTQPEVTALVLTVPYYGSFDDPDMQVAFFETVADEAPRPIILYNIPQMVHARLEPETVARLASHPNIIGVKDSSGDLIRFQQLLTLRHPHEFAVYQGAEQLAGLSLLAGTDGLISGMANLVPGWLAEMLEAAQKGEVERVLNIQQRLNELWTLHTAGHWLSCLKMAASLLDLCGPTVSAPLPRLSPEAAAHIQKTLARYGLPMVADDVTVAKEVTPQNV